MYLSKTEHLKLITSCKLLQLSSQFYSNIPENAQSLGYLTILMFCGCFYYIIHGEYILKFLVSNSKYVLCPTLIIRNAHDKNLYVNEMSVYQHYTAVNCYSYCAFLTCTKRIWNGFCKRDSTIS